MFSGMRSASYLTKLLEGTNVSAFISVLHLEFSTVSENSLHLLHVCQMNKKEENIKQFENS